jgi:hypothetical protein
MSDIPSVFFISPQPAESKVRSAAVRRFPKLQIANCRLNGKDAGGGISSPFLRLSIFNMQFAICNQHRIALTGVLQTTNVISCFSFDTVPRREQT